MWKKLINFVEEWKPLIYKDLDLSDRFLISNTGKLYSKVSNKILKTRIQKTGYEIVCVSLGHRNKKKIIRIHVAVACMFVEGRKDNLVVNHKDANKLNNNSYNLEWVTRKKNVQHAKDNGLLYNPNKKPIKQIDIKTNEVINTFKSISEAIKYITNKQEASSKNLYDTLENRNGRNGYAYGYKWEYI